ncbi:MAG: flagellar export chaperone FliS [Pseudomonas sp.]|uniref:flagellar export chaperone FliS n=1 Tax=Pseudomonas abieticivorans TaxID=2931382 RepID=UPI0020BF2937|nr:flagellar export chaperone FliS [Pseudomonas sp. PIA16]MDE1168412.1 flagellar export chaperone FliS [Pseudomonas sp.]
MRGAKAYAKVGVESGILAASPYQRIVMLFDSYQAAIRMARLHMQAGDMAGKGKAITKAVNIVSRGLRGSLDKERGGEVAANLDQLYDTVVRLLLRASLNNDEQALDVAASLLENIGSAWRQIGPQVEGEVGDGAGAGD